jgi:predicted GIY-YIG superfamily endonuclease
MLGSRTYYIYILTNKSGTLYTGVTGNLKKRLWQHKTKEVEGFTKKYNIDRLIYYDDLQQRVVGYHERKADQGLGAPAESGTHRFNEPRMARSKRRVV